MVEKGDRWFDASLIQYIRNAAAGLQCGESVLRIQLIVLKTTSEDGDGDHQSRT
jgi:hypothetical protein